MGAQQRVFRQRISAVRSTKKITKAMELIAASRIVKAQQRVAESHALRRGHHRDGHDRGEQLVDRARAHHGAGEPRPGGRAGHHQRPRTGRRLQQQRAPGGGAAHGPAARRGHGPRAVRRRAQGCCLLPVPQPGDGAELDRLLRAAAVRERQGDRRHPDRCLPRGSDEGGIDEIHIVFTEFIRR